MAKDFFTLYLIKVLALKLITADITFFTPLVSFITLLSRNLIKGRFRNYIQLKPVIVSRDIVTSSL